MPGATALERILHEGLSFRQFPDAEAGVVDRDFGGDSTRHAAVRRGMRAAVLEHLLEKLAERDITIVDDRDPAARADS
jgi:hypothetical protein